MRVSENTKPNNMKTYAIINTCSGKCHRDISALEALEHLGYRVEFTLLRDDETDEESEVWLVGILNRTQHEMAGATSAEDAAEKYLESRLGKKQLAGFGEASLDSYVMPEGHADDFINEVCSDDEEHIATFWDEK